MLPPTNLTHQVPEIFAARANETTLPLALLIVDIREFGALNDSFGFGFGNFVLDTATTKLSCAFGKEQICYLGDDEFLVIHALDEQTETLDQLCEKVVDLFDETMTWQGVTVKISVNIGAAACPLSTIQQYLSSDQSLQTLCNHMQLAVERTLQKAKAGNQQYLAEHNFIPSPSDTTKWALLNSMHDALHPDSEELSLHFQPKVPANKNKINYVDAELLIRWHSHEHGVISPAKALPLIEHLGSEGSLLEWILDSAISYLENHAQTHVSINVGVHAIETGLLKTLLDSVVKERVEHNRLTIEVTEQAFSEQRKKMFVELERIRRLGYRVSIDDFGTGYSSLAYLRSLPADELKIDKLFIKHLATNPTDQAIVRLIIEAAHTRDMCVVAEGVEDQATFDMLVSLDCDMIQGFHIAKPLPLAEFNQWIESYPLTDD